MKPIDEILTEEESRWRGKSFQEIESLEDHPHCYSVTRSGTTYQFEIHTEKSQREREILVRVECSKNIFGKAKYFAISADRGVRDIEDEEAF